MATPDHVTVVWVGPVSASNLSAVQLPPGWSLKVVSKGDPDPAAPAGPAPPAIRAGAFRRLITASSAPDPLAAVVGDDDLVLLCAFSAGGAFVDEVHRRPELRARVVGTLLADGLFLTTNVDAIDADPGDVAAARAALQGGAPFWATGGPSAGPGHLSGIESLNRLAADVPVGSETSAPPALSPPPSASIGGASLKMMALPQTPHVEHATRIAAQLLRAMLADEFDFDRPLLAKIPPPGGAPSPSKAKRIWITDARGRVKIQIAPAEGGGALYEIPIVRTANRGAFEGALAYESLARAAARRHRAPLSWVVGVIAAESGGDPNAVSPVGARGLMQIMPSTAKAFGVSADALFDPKVNVDVGAQILGDDAAAHFDLPAAASRYNAGPSQKTGVKLNAADPWGYVEDTGYIDRVVEASNSYVEERGGAGAGGKGGGGLVALGALGALYLASRGRRG